MTVRVEIKGFQSIAHSVVEVDSFSALVGPSNIGKSAVVRAIKAALTGAPADAFVRHDGECARVVKGAKACKCFCSVRLTAPGFDLLWEKGDAKNRYVYNSVEYTAVSRGTPEFLSKDFAPAKIGDEKELLQISDQFRPIFILDKSGTVVADVLSDVIKLDQINVAIRLAEKDRKEAASTRKVREKDIADLKLTMSVYAGLDEVLGQVRVLGDSDNTILEAQRVIEQLDQFIETAYGAARNIKELGRAQLIEVPLCSELVTNFGSLVTLLRFDKSVSERAPIVDQLRGVEDVPLPSVEGFVESGATLGLLDGWSSKLLALRLFYADAKKVETLEVPQVGDLRSDQEVLSKLMHWSSKLSSLSKLVEQLENDAKEAIQKESQALEEFEVLGVCPTCSQGFSAPGHQHH